MPLCRAASFEPTAALVTGASSGIGAAFARALPPTADLVLVGRDEDRLAAIAGELGTARKVQAVVADLGSEAGRAKVIEAAEAAAIDLLVNNAGSGTFGAFLDAGERSAQQVLEVNVVGLTALTRALLPGMIERARTSGRRAALVNVASTAAFAPVPLLAVYAASKAYVLSLTEALAIELRSAPVHVLAVCPGATRSRFGERSGFRPGALPGAGDPDQVARRALRAIGRQNVAFTDMPSEAALRPLASLRRASATALGLGVDLLRRAQGA
jgi:uncharacterized protein